VTFQVVFSLDKQLQNLPNKKRRARRIRKLLARKKQQGGTFRPCDHHAYVQGGPEDGEMPVGGQVVVIITSGR